MYHRVDNYENPILIEPARYKDVVDLKNIEYLSIQKFATIFRLGIKNKFIKEFFNPNFFEMQLNKNKIIKKLKNIIHEIFEENKGDLIQKCLNLINTNNNGDIIDKYIIFNLIYIFSKLLELFKIEKLNDKNLEDHFKTLKEKFKVMISKCSHFDFSLNQFRLNMLINNNEINNLLETLLKFLEKDKNIPFFRKQKLINALEFHFNILEDNNKKNSFHKNLNKKISIKKWQFLLKFTTPWVDIEFFENKKSYQSLSSGEKMIFSFMVNLMYQINNAKDKYNTINLFLDEIELTLHPEWQRKYIYYILNTIENFKSIKINIILATHSLFILSDLPKENIIFMKDGKNVSNEVDIETFGANIHTLLSHAFFMEEGLMGEYASGKINDVINYFNNEELKIKNDEEAQKIINLIGEPIIRNELQRRLSSKRLEKINNINEKIKLLEYELEILKKHQAKCVKDELLDRGKKEYFLKKKDEKNNNN